MIGDETYEMNPDVLFDGTENIETTECSGRIRGENVEYSHDLGERVVSASRSQ